MHILLVRFSSMGDVVLQTAVVNWLRSLWGESLKLSFVTSSEFLNLVDQHPGLNQTFSFNRRGEEKWQNFIRKLKKTHKECPFDLIIDLHGTLRSLRLRYSFWRVPSLVVDKRSWERFLLVRIKNPLVKKIFQSPLFDFSSQAERVIKDFETIFLDDHGIRRTRGHRHGPHEELTSLPVVHDLKTFDHLFSSPLIILAPSASFSSKRWPVKSFVELAKKLLASGTYHVAVLAGPEDKFCEAFGVIEDQRFFNLQGKTNLKTTMGILSRSKLCIGNDSGLNHIAEAYGVRCLTLFGSTDPRFGFSPHGKKSRFLMKEIFCRPCSTTGKKECWRDRHYCMEEISPDEVFQTTLDLLEEE